MSEGGDDAAAREVALDRASAALLDAYLDHLRIERRLSANTVESYARDLAYLGRFAAGIGRRWWPSIAARSSSSCAS